MIKVIVSDLDDTLLGSDHKISKVNADTIKKAQDAGYRFIVATGRQQTGADSVLVPAHITCECIVASGAEVNDAERNNLKRICMTYEELEKVVEIESAYGMRLLFFTDQGDYMIGTEKEKDELIVEEVAMFFLSKSVEEIRNSEYYKMRDEMVHRLERVTDFEKQKIEVYKIFVFSQDFERLKEAKKALEGIDFISTATAFINSIEITSIKAQKGPVLKEFIEERGYTMDEVMILGDSPNDWSMFDMDFGATVAVANGYEEIKDAAQYITKSNAENGVAYAIEKVMAGELEELRNPKQK